MEGCPRGSETILDHYRNYGEVPTARAFKDNLPTYKLVDYEDPYELVIDRVVRQRRMYLATVLVSDLNKALADEDAGPDDILDLVAQGTQEMHSQTGTLRDVDLDKTGDERLAHYIALESLENHLLGLPTGFPTLDKALAGLQPEQFVTLAAVPKVGSP